MPAPEGPRTGRPPFRGEHTAVATPHSLATQAGVDALRRGGSAVDAAVAANAVLCVVYPHMAGLGGDGFWLVAEPGGTVHGVNASGPAASTATRDFYRDRGWDAEIPARGALSALTVPGAVDGWRLVHERFGRLAWQDLFGDAVALARRGAPVGRSLADWLVEDADLLRGSASAAAVFLPDGRPARQGERLVQRDLASSLERLARDGARAGFYEGETARLMSDAVGRGADAGPLHEDDFAAFRAEWVEPLSARYRDATVYELPPNTQGFTALQLLQLFDGFDVAAWGDGSADYYHHAAEAVKLAFADRDEWLTDARHVDIPLDVLLCAEYVHRRRALIDPERAMVMDEVEPGLSFGRHARVAAPGDTCAFSAADGDGLMVSVIQSVYHDFGSGVVAGGTGIVPQNRGSFFSLDDEHPNTLEPGKRTFHTLIPGLAVRDGAPWLAFGSMGGEGQPQTHLALLTRILDFGHDVQQAVEAPRWLMGRTWGAASRELWLEGRIGDEVARELVRRGQPVARLDDWDDNAGHAQAVLVDRESGFYEAGADPRGDGSAAGF
jgi:gamma-glutamyltranspeptidase